MSERTDTQGTQSTHDTQPERPAAERAEEIVDRAGERVGQVIASLGHRLRVATARAREEAEDIWAEAQSMRQQNQR